MSDFILTPAQVAGLEHAEADWISQAEEQLEPTEFEAAKAEFQAFISAYPPESRVYFYSTNFADAGFDTPKLLDVAAGWKYSDNDPYTLPLYQALEDWQSQTGETYSPTKKAGFGGVGVLLAIGVGLALLMNRR